MIEINMLLTIGLLLTIGYAAGWLLDKIGLPKIIGYITTGIVLSPNTFPFISQETLASTEPLMDACLAFIAFEVGGALKWAKIKKHEKEIISITLLASIFPYILIALGVYCLGFFFPALFPFNTLSVLVMALLLGALASPTDPSATLAVMHQYKAKGKVSDTIMGVAALDDALGILLFSITVSIAFMLMGGQEESVGFSMTLFGSLYQIGIALLVGFLAAVVMNYVAKIFRITYEGQWIVMIISFIILCMGVAKYVEADELLACMTMGLVVVNKSDQQKKIFKIIERYTEELIFLIFFLLSGLHLDISTVPKAALLIAVFVIIRTLGKYLGANVGARMVRADRAIQKYTAGGLLPQAGIVIGLVLHIYQNEVFREISDIVLTTIMGAIIIHELIGPLAAKYSLTKAGEIESNAQKNKVKHYDVK